MRRTFLSKTVTYKLLVLAAGLGLSGVLAWFAVANYYSARPVAEENLRGVALSVAEAVETLALKDPTLHTLAGFHPANVAYFALIDHHGIYRFHTNSDLIGAPAENSGDFALPEKHLPLERRVTLHTGEQAYEFIFPLRLPGEGLLLQLVLHTYRSDEVIRQARFTLILLLALLVAGWGLVIVILRLMARGNRYRQEIARQESLVRLGELGATLAHEIRNPLAGIKGFAQWIERKPTDERNRSYAERIVVEVRRLERLVGDLLAYARSEPYPMTSTPLAELLADLLSNIGNEAAAAGVRSEVDCPDELYVYANGDRLGQLLLNLCLNAIQAMPDGGVLAIAVRHDTGHLIEITVTDSGDGIPAELLPRIFEPFFTTKARGTGLGLALCRKIAEEHGGTLTAVNVPAGGARFALTLTTAPPVARKDQ